MTLLTLGGCRAVIAPKADRGATAPGSAASASVQPTRARVMVQDLRIHVVDPATDELFRDLTLGTTKRY